MGADNRIRTFGDWPTAEMGPTAADPWCCPLYTDFNNWQSRWIRTMNFTNCAQFSGWRGAMWQYGQRETIGTGTSETMSLINPWRQTAHPGRTLDLRNRIVLVKMWTELPKDDLPKGATYDPDTFVNAPTWNLMWTGSGATDTNPPVGCFWTPWANIYFHAATDGSCFYIRNESGAEINVAMSMWIFQNTVVGYADKRIWTNNRYQVPWAAQMNDLQDYNLQFNDLNQGILMPVNTLEGAAIYYGQFTYANGTATAIDQLRDWRERIMLTYWQEVTAANELPVGAAYDPDTAATKGWNLWSTEAGGTPGGPWVAGDIAWIPRANMYLCASNAALGGIFPGDLIVYNNTGAAAYGMILTIQSQTIA